MVVALGWKRDRWPWGGGGCGLCNDVVGWCCREVWLGTRGKKEKKNLFYNILIGCIVK